MGRNMGIFCGISVRFSEWFLLWELEAEFRASARYYLWNCRYFIRTICFDQPLLEKKLNWIFRMIFTQHIMCSVHTVIEKKNTRPSQEYSLPKVVLEKCLVYCSVDLDLSEQIIEVDVNWPMSFYTFHHWSTNYAYYKCHQSTWNILWWRYYLYQYNAEISFNPSYCS